MANFSECADTLICSTLSGSNGIGISLELGTPNKIVVSASNIPNSALANNSININGTTIPLGATGSLAIGDITAVAAGTNLSGGGTSGSLTVSLTSSITGGLTNISGLTTLSSSQISGTFSGSLLGTASYATLAGTAATASYVATGSAIATFTNDVRNQFRAGSNIGISAGVISLSSSVSTAALSGTTGVSGTLGLFTNLTGTNISGSRISGSFSGSGALINNLTASNISNFTNDVRAQFTAGTNITITNGQIDATGGGVGTISPGNQNRVAYYSDVDGGTTINDASSLFYDNNALGIGYSPTGKYKLEVSGNGLFSKTVFTSLPATYFNDWMLQIHREQSDSALKESGHLVLTAPNADGTAAALYFGISGSTTNNTYSWIQSRLPTTDTADNRILSLNPNGGSVGIGTTTPNSAYTLDVAGTGRFTSNVEITGTVKAITQLTASSISSSTNITTGKIYFTPAVSGFDSYLCIKNSNGEIVRETSDARLKENITYFDNQEMLNVALQLKPAKYSWIERENPEEIDVGFIAQDVLSVFPPAVGAEYQGYYGFKINKIIPVAIGAIKQLKQENDELKQKLNEVLARLSALENK